MKKLDFIRKMFSHSKFDKNSSVSLEAARKYYDTLLPYDKDNIDKYVVKIPISIVYDNLKKFRKYLRYYIHYKTQSTPVDPYIIGVWLGDGSKHTSKITNIDSEVVEAFYDYAKSIGLEVRKYGIEYHASSESIVSHKTPKATVLAMIEYYFNEKSANQINTAKKFNISPRTVRRYLKDIEKVVLTQLINILYKVKPTLL